nr:similar to H28G03.4 [Haemonchus contortus]
MVSLDDRSAVVAMYKSESSVSEISKMLKLHREQVHRVIKRFEETGKIENRPRGRPERTARTSALRKAVKDKLRRDPERTMRKLAKEHNVSNSTMQRLVKEDIGLYPYKIARGQRLTEEMKASRLEKCKKMKTFGENLGRILFTDEKIFTVEPFRNPQNQRILLPKGSPREVMVERSHFPQWVMVWAGISGLGKTKLVFVEKE